MHVYTIMSAKADSSLEEKNAADSLGDISFIVGTKAWPEARGVESYYHDGRIAVTHVSVHSWGTYLQCEHPKDSTKYTCHCPINKPGSHVYKQPCSPSHVGKFDHAGRVQNSHTNMHWWYSFPKSAHDKADGWSYITSKGCGQFEVEASCVIDALSKKAGCPGICGHDTDKCAHCIAKMTDTTKKEAWDDAIWKHCDHVPGRRRHAKAAGNAMLGNMSSAEYAGNALVTPEDQELSELVGAVMV